MFSLWRKLPYLVLFFIVYFILCRIHEYWVMRARRHGSGVIDPVLSKVGLLKSILSRRGLPTETGIERPELVAMVHNSGRLTDVEVDEVNANAQPRSPLSQTPPSEGDEAGITKFSNPAHFDELVEDCKDSAWLVEIRQNSVPVVPPRTWRSLNRYLRHFDIRIGRIDCYQHSWLCISKAFHRSGLLLAMPKGRSRMKDSVAFSWFTRSPQLPAILSWLATTLATRVQPLREGTAALERLRNGSQTEEGTAGDFVVSLDLDRLPQVPLLLSALSVRFTGRVRFWSFDTARARAPFRAGGDGARSFLVSGHSSAVYEYGSRADRSEPTTFRALELFLKMNYPEANDVFIALSYPVVMLALLSLAVASKRVLYRVFNCLASLVIYGILFLIIYLPVEHLLSLKNMQGLRLALLSLCQVLARSDLGALLRRDCLAERYSAPFICAAFLLFLGLVILIERKRTGDETEEEDVFMLVPNQSVPRPYIPEEAQMHHVVSYLYSSLWLPPDDFSKEYVESLPVWICAKEPYAASDEETAVGSADEGNDWPAGAIHCRQCSVCLCDFRKGVSLCALPCHHVFHERCIKRWLQNPEQDSCPNCRWLAFKVK